MYCTVLYCNVLYSTLNTPLSSQLRSLLPTCSLVDISAVTAQHRMTKSSQEIEVTVRLLCILQCSDLQCRSLQCSVVQSSVLQYRAEQ